MVAIIDYRAGNLTSVKLAFESLGAPCRVTRSRVEIAAADRVVFPGVGAAAAAMEHLRSSGLDRLIVELAAGERPFLGICLGAQILFDFSEEDGGTPLLGILPGAVRRLRPLDARAKVPHMGWNQVHPTREHPLMQNIPNDSDFYFVHGYCIAPERREDLIGHTEFGGIEFASMVGRANVVATQFHVEKSGPVGMRLLRNFLAWDGRLPQDNHDTGDVP